MGIREEAFPRTHYFAQCEIASNNDPTRVDLIFGSHSQLRAFAEV
jgi:catalase (peroxidase I)